MTKVAVIGAGIAGLLPAYYLAKKGYDVTIIDQERYAGMKCSYANGGQISVSNSEVWNSWSNVGKGLKWMFKKDAPLLITPYPEWNKIKWLAKFLWHIKDHDTNTAETIRLGLESRNLYKEIIAEEQIQFNQSDCGILHIYKNQNYFDAAKSVADLYEKNGCTWKVVSPINIEPKLKTNDIIGGIWTPEDWVGDIHKFCTELTRILVEKYRVQLFFNYRVDNLDIVDSYDKVIVSSGIESVRLAKTIGDKLLIYPVKGYSITIPAKDIKNYEAMPKASILDDEAKIVCSFLGDRLRVAGTAELSGENYDIKRDRISPLLRWVHKNFPDVDCSEYSSWACLRPMTPDMMPIVKQSVSNKNVYYHTGHGHLGWTLSPATAKKLIGLMT